MLTKYDTFIFDLGSVLVYLDRQGCIDEFKKLGISSAESFIGQSAQNGVFGELELGLITEQEFYQRIREITMTKLSDEEVRFAWNRMILDTPVRLLHSILKLKSLGKKTLMLSNVNPIHIRTVEERHFRQIDDKDIDSYFDMKFLSHEMHLKKPDPRIYERVAEEAKLDKSRTLFFDDNIDNVNAAISVGISAMQVLSPDAMADLLESEFRRV